MPIYLDHAATTPLAPDVLASMMPYLTTEFGNASSVHAPGRMARFAIEDARARIAALLGAHDGEILFTSGATEANNTALKGVLRAGDHLITTLIEHEAILEPARALAKAGVLVTFLKPDAAGAVTLEQVQAARRPETRMVSVMYVNNEIGSVSPIAAIGAWCKQEGLIFHTDAVQAMGLYAPQVDDLNVDLLSASAHKFYGPKGVGFLYIRGGIELQPFVHGGSQERKRRGGTESVAQVVGLVTALERVWAKAIAEQARLVDLRTRLVASWIQKSPVPFRFNTPLEHGLAAPHILSISFPPVHQKPFDGEMLLLNLDMAGVYVSSGSACTSGAIEPSHVLEALGVPPETADATVRFSLGESTTWHDLEQAVEVLVHVLNKMQPASV